MQQVPEEIERVLVGIEAYMGIRKHVPEDGLCFFDGDEENEEQVKEKV